MATQETKHGSTQSRPTEAGAKERGGKSATCNKAVKVKLEGIKRSEAKMEGSTMTKGDFLDLCASQTTGG